VTDPFADAMGRLLASACGPEVVSAAEREWPSALWQAVESSGIPLVGVREERDGAGGGWPEMAAVIRTAARWAAPIPLAETIVARHLADRAGLDLPAGPISLAAGDDVALDARGRLTGSLRRVPWGRQVAAIVITVRGRDDVVGRVDMAGARNGMSLEHGENLAREPRDSVQFDALPVAVAAAGEVVGAQDGGALTGAAQISGGLARSAQISGALERALALSAEHAGVREQFGRPIAKFQAVQDLIARLAGESAATRAAVDAAARTGADLRAVAAAKVRASIAASEGARLAHQIHGAIGVTYEHQLHHFTTRLWSWRDEFGTEAAWARALGTRVSAEGGAGFWAWLTTSAGTA
jgi:alkylation response protein AidB-like acyl-CoA dehydrogenase